MPTFVSLGAPLSSAPPIVDTKAVPLTGVVASASVPCSQRSAVGSVAQTPSVTVPVPAAPTAVVKQRKPVRPYMGATSYKACKEYFKRICWCATTGNLPRSAPVTFWLLWTGPPSRLYVDLRPRIILTLHRFGKLWPAALVSLTSLRELCVVLMSESS